MYTWVTGSGYEVSTKGDKRFSALVARLRDGRTVETIYQTQVKGYATWREGKGKPPKTVFEGDDLYLAYRDIWIQWAKENPALITELKTLVDQHNGQLSDCFAHGRPVNQARALADILNDNY